MTTALVATGPVGGEAVAGTSAGPTDLSGRAGERWVTRTLERMSLEEKVGQLFVTNVYGSSPTTVTAAEAAANQFAYGVDTPAEVVAKYHLGGVIYFAWTNSVQNPPQIARLSNGLQRAALTASTGSPTSGVPLLVTVDQEQGVVTRIGPPATQFPGNMALGAGRSSRDTRTAARVTGTELRAMGVNMNFAPDADVNVNPANPVIGVRSFSSDPQLAAELVGAAVHGYQDGAGVAATAKHFPGHGDTATDSHTGVPVITHTREQWMQLDLPPFEAAIAAGVDAIMTAHIVVPSLDPSGRPSTLSEPIVTGILRDELGFHGVVFTDALTMQGVRDQYGDDRIPLMALQAGVDVLLMPFEGTMDTAYGAVLAAVRSGALTERRIDASVRRILELKWARGIVADPTVDVSQVPSTVGTAHHLAAARRVTEATTTLVKNEGTLPFPVSGQDVLVTGYGDTPTGTLTQELMARGAVAARVVTGVNPDDAVADAAVSAAMGKDLVVVLTNNVAGSAAQRALLTRLAGTGVPVVAAAVRNPYDVAYDSGLSGWLATYSFTDVAVRSLARVLTGEVRPAGKLPVDVPAAGPGTVTYPFGHGLSW